MKIRSDLHQLKNLDDQCIAWLAEIGIRSRAELARVGPAPAYMEMKTRHPELVSLEALWAMAGGLAGLEAAGLPLDFKQNLLNEILGAGLDSISSAT